MTTIRTLAVLLCFSGLLRAQVFEDIVKDADDLELWSALQYDRAEAIVSHSNHELIELTPDQRDRIKSLNFVFSEQTGAMLDASWGIEKGTYVDETRPAPDQPPEFRAEMARQAKGFEQKLLGELLPFQIELVEDVVLRERFKVGGLRAVVASTDLPIAAELRLELTPMAIDSRLKEANEKANQKIRDLGKEFQKVVDAFQQKASEIRERELSAALDDLGSDGDKLRIIISQAAGEKRS